jgi:hypothetical protein
MSLDQPSLGICGTIQGRSKHCVFPPPLRESLWRYVTCGRQAGQLFFNAPPKHLDLRVDSSQFEGRRVLGPTTSRATAKPPDQDRRSGQGSDEAEEAQRPLADGGGRRSSGQ